MGSSGARQLVSVVRITQDSVNSTTTLANIVGAAFPIAANEVLHFEARLILFTAATTTGAAFGVTGPASPTRVRLAAQHTNSGGTATQPRQAAAFGAIGAAFVSTWATVSPGQWDMVYGSINNGPNAGTVQLQFASGVAASAVTVEASSLILVYR